MSGSLGSVARIGLTLGGYAVGAAFGNPAIGGFIGSLAGSLLFPGELPDLQGPRLGPDQGVTAAGIGVAIPILYGTIDVNGIVIQDLGRVEIENTEEVGGKGAPSQEVTNYTYTRTYAVLLCDTSNGRPIDGVLRMWRNGKLVYDIRVQQDGESDEDYNIRVAASEGFAERFNLYLGTHDQLPDPVLEAAVGVGLQPAYRHRAYIVFVDEDVTDNSGRTSQWKFEVVANGTFNSSDVTEYSNGVLYDWESGDADPRKFTTEDELTGDILQGNRHEYSAGGAFVDDFSTAMDQYEIARGFRPKDTIRGWSLNGNERADGLYLTSNPVDESQLNLFVSFRDPVGIVEELPFTGPGILCTAVDDFSRAAVDGRMWLGFGAGGEEEGTTQIFVVDSPYDGGALPPAPLNTVIASTCTGYDPSFLLWTESIGGLGLNFIARRQPGAPNNPCNGRPSLPENPNYCVLTSGGIKKDQEWALSEIPAGYKVLQSYEINGSSNLIDQLPLSPALLVGHEDDTEAYWTAAYEAAVIAGTAVAGKTFDAQGDGNPLTTYPNLQDYAYLRVLNADSGIPLPVTLASIVSDLCTRRTFGYDPELDEPGLVQDDLDVSDLLETVQGYRVDRVMTRRQAIEPLMRYGYFDCVDGAVLKFPTRGKAVVAALDEDTLAAHEAGSAVPPLVEPTNVEDVELPRFIGVRYPMPHADYQVGMQGQPRATRPNSDIQYLDMPIAMSDAKAAQISEVLQSVALTERERYTFSVSPRWLALEAADNVTVPLSGETQRVMLTSITGGFPGPLKCEAVRSDPSDYLSTAAGVASNIAGQQLGIAGLTVYALIDGPAFDERQDDPGFYVAAYGTGTRWRGASLYESVDGGENYTRILSVSAASTMGVIESALGVGPHHIWDEANTLTVTLGAGTLESRTDAAVLNGANAAFVGADGRWELIQFRTATLVSPGVYTLSGLLRGRRGTEWAIGQSVAGDTFVLCSTLQRVAKGTSAIGAERLYKMVTSRTLLESSEAETFGTDGVALECYAPAQITASRDASGNITFTILRRARLGPEWIDYADVPLNEDSERYQIDVLDGATVVRTIDTGSATASYTAAEQTTDFGAPVGFGLLDIVGYQLSATVGRGYPTEATV